MHWACFFPYLLYFFPSLSFQRQLTKPFSSMLLQLRQVQCLLNITHPFDKERQRCSHFTFCQDIHSAALTCLCWAALLFTWTGEIDQKIGGSQQQIPVPAFTGSFLQEDCSGNHLAEQQLISASVEQSSGPSHRQEAKQNRVHVSEHITTPGLQVLGTLRGESEAMSTAGPGPTANHHYQYDRWMNCLLLKLSLCRMVLTFANAAGAPRHMDTAFNDILASTLEGSPQSYCSLEALIEYFKLL